jgi:Fur family zinc uptake transcriptional regulator|tara:strand:+ start:3293 stop:3742 length:450 start_codon:yes stop_codon:yes gene_type:complete
MNDIVKTLAHAEQSCQSHGARLTDKRKAVLSGLLTSGKALSAYELVDYCRDELDTSIPAMSVYRILAFLEQENLVHKLHVTNKYVACSHISCEHAHEIPQFLICESCGNVKEIGIKKSLIDTLKDNVEQAGYHLKSPQLELHCLCQNCV